VTRWFRASATPAQHPARVAIVRPYRVSFAAYRNAVIAARVTLRTDTRSIIAAFKASTASARAIERAAIKAVRPTYLASARALVDRQAFHALVVLARVSFTADLGVAEALATRARVSARAAHQVAIRAARAAFFAATGHYPYR